MHLAGCEGVPPCPFQPWPVRSNARPVLCAQRRGPHLCLYWVRRAKAADEAAAVVIAKPDGPKTASRPLKNMSRLALARHGVRSYSVARTYLATPLGDRGLVTAVGDRVNKQETRMK